MFENILHQDRVVQSIKDDLAHGSLPAAILFSGPSWAGKYSTALELARVLSCRTPGAPWNCDCSSCTMQRTLGSPWIQHLGARPFGREIRGAGIALRGDQRDAIRYLFVRTVRKLLRRFDPVLWEGDPKFTKAVKLVERLEECLDPLLPGRTMTDLAKAMKAPATAKSGKVKAKAKEDDGEPVPATAQDLGRWLEDLYPVADELADLLPQDGVNAAMVRRATYWAHTADASMPKFIIIEGPESLNESTRNSLLKTLEEPPPHVWFILLSRHRQAVMQTILSRVRTYHFADRGLQEADVVSRVFRQSSADHRTLADYFFAADPQARDQVEALARRLWQHLSGPARPGAYEELIAMAVAAKGYTEDVLRRLYSLGRAALLDAVADDEGGDSVVCADLPTLDRLYRILARTQTEGQNALVYNRSLASVVEALLTAPEETP